MEGYKAGCGGWDSAAQGTEVTLLHFGNYGLEGYKIHVEGASGIFHV